jgi:hypothetical protein
VLVGPSEGLRGIFLTDVHLRRGEDWGANQIVGLQLDLGRRVRTSSLLDGVSPPASLSGSATGVKY